MLACTRVLVLVAIIAIAAALIPPSTVPSAAQDAAGNHPLGKRALENVIAFTRLVGYVQYFYPGDEAAATDWNRFTVEGMRAVEHAPDAERLIALLREQFAPVAPLVQIYATGTTPNAIPVPDDMEGLHLVTWYHRGLQTPETPLWTNGQPVYSSTRLTRNPGDPPPQDYPDFPAPGTAYTADLGGVTVTVPLVLWADDTGTLPRTDMAVEAHLPATTWSADMREARLAGVALAWNVIQHSYPYFDVVDVDWLQVLSDTLQHAATDSGHDGYVLTLRWMLTQLDDGHTHVSAADTGKAERTSLLPFAWAWIDDQAVITYVFPTAQDMLQPGDIVHQIDGIPVADLLAARQIYVGAATPQYKRLITLQTLLEAAPDQTVTLSVQRLDGAPEDMVVTASITRELFRAALQTYLLFETRPNEPVDELEPGIWYVDIARTPSFMLDMAVAQIYGAQGLILDMRGYPHPDGMWIADLLDLLSDEPCPYIPITAPQIPRPDQDGIVFPYSPDTTPILTKDFRPVVAERLIVMTNEIAVSKAELYLSIIEHCTDATIIGSPSAGTNGDMNELRLPGGYSMTWTGAQVRNYDGTPFHGVGILPDVPIARTRQAVIEGRDDILEAAIEMVRE